MTDSMSCSSCGEPITQGAPLGLCAACLMKLALAAKDSTRMESRPAAAERPGPGTAQGAEVTPAAIGPYRILRVLGEGGMGVVYLAEQTEPLHRRVAVKVIKIGMNTREVVARFEAERQTLARMNHPNIARVYDAGATTDGRPYFVMEYVSGSPMTDYCDAHTLSTRARLGLFIDVCLAIQHAHQKGVIHRDVKPSNVLVFEQDGRPVPKVIDFGIAKAVERTQTAETALTEQGLMVGTPEYMSPEQAAASTDIDTTTDVYSLGLLLYELLVGTLPFDPRMLRAAGFDEIRRIIRESDPPRPSARLSALGQTGDTVAARRRTDADSLMRHLKGDLDWIALKALEKDRRRRYETVAALAADIARYLDNEPVIARPPSAAYRVAKFVRRHRLGVAASVMLVVVLTGGLAGTSIMYFRAAREARRNRIDVDAFAAWVQDVSTASDHQGLPHYIPLAREAIALERTALEANPAAFAGLLFTHMMLCANPYFLQAPPPGVQQFQREMGRQLMQVFLDMEEKKDPQVLNSVRPGSEYDEMYVPTDLLERYYQGLVPLAEANPSLAREYNILPQVADTFRDWSQAIVEHRGRPFVAYAHALDLAERALAIEPNEPGIVQTLALAQYRLDKFADALASADRLAVLRANPTFRDLTILAVTSAEGGRSDEARRALSAIEKRRASSKNEALSPLDQELIWETQRLLAAKEAQIPLAESRR